MKAARKTLMKLTPEFTLYKFEENQSESVFHAECRQKFFISFAIYLFPKERFTDLGMLNLLMVVRF